MRFHLFNSLGVKGTPAHNRGGTLSLDLLADPPSTTPKKKYAAPHEHNPSNSRVLKPSKSWHALLLSQHEEGGRSSAHASRPVIPPDPAGIHAGPAKSPKSWYTPLGSRPEESGRGRAYGSSPFIPPEPAGIYPGIPRIFKPRSTPPRSQPKQDEQGRAHASYPVILPDPASAYPGRETATRERYRYEHELPEDTHDKLSDDGIKLSRPHQAKMESIEEWRLQTRVAEESSDSWSQCAVKGETRCPPLKLHKPAGRRDPRSFNRRPKAQSSAAPRPFDQPLQQGRWSKSVAYPSGIGSKSTPR